MKKIIVVWAIFFLITGSSLNAQTGDSFRIEGLVQYFQPSEEAFKDIYGSGIMFGGEISFKVWEWIYIWTGADYYNKGGKTTFTQEDTDLRITPIYGGVMFQLPNPRFKPYTALGIGYFLYEEENPIGQIDGSEIGYIIQLGLRVEAVGPLFFDVKGAYSICKTQPGDFEVDLGGVKGGIGIGLEF